ncbi:DNA-processing protein DprA [Labrenzia sp. OB1]|uniref:DNA-processing protein DprA n=1 Tax=Labrenzia sp. OB1 TaxID=1561204 RepID=UPI0008387B41|nr:DNA-processing protein DprA [Labrenzia sp. OB1]
MATSSISSTSLALTALMKLKGVGRRAALRIVHGPVPDSEAKEIIVDRVKRAKLPEIELRNAWDRAEAELENTEASGIKFYSFHDEGYPTRLRKIPDPPAVLYVKGDTSGLHSSKCLAVVGTREPTPYGEAVARKSAATAAEAGFIIVSGLAHGCDTLGHEGCLDAHGVGVAVMAHGLDKVYPAANRGLASRLLENGGCLVSEYPLGFKPMRTAFAERDRIQSGLSDAVLVVETDVKGGTMHTVRFSREQKRILACIDHPAKWKGEDKTKGNQMMIAERWARGIADGAALTQLLADIENLEPSIEPAPEQPSSTGAQTSMAF